MLDHRRSISNHAQPPLRFVGREFCRGLFNSPLLEPLNAVWRHKTIQALNKTRRPSIESHGGLRTWPPN